MRKFVDWMGKITSKAVWPSLLTIVLFTMVKITNQPICSSVDEWATNTHTLTMKLSLPIKCIVTVSLQETWLNWKASFKQHKPSSEKLTVCVCVFFHIWNLNPNTKLHTWHEIKMQTSYRREETTEGRGWGALEGCVRNISRTQWCTFVYVNV